MDRALAGIRVVEQGTFITGPCAGMMLADLGADVIKIESPEGDPYRAYQGGQYSPHFQAYNRNKRSVALDMKQPGDGELFDSADPRGGRLHPELPSGHGRATRRGRRAAAVDQSASGVLLDQRFRLKRPLHRPAELRLRGAGAERLSERRRRLPPAAVPRARPGGCDHRHVCSPGHPRGVGPARPHCTGQSC